MDQQRTLLVPAGRRSTQGSDGARFDRVDVHNTQGRVSGLNLPLVRLCVQVQHVHLE